jgi:ribosome-binding protein aMBF1 (putative translation factor)
MGRKLALLLKGASENEQSEIFDAMAEVVFPQSMVGGGIKPEKEVSGDGREKLSRYRRAVGQQIRKHREKLEMTQEQLAQKTSLPQSHISRLEAGAHAPTHITIKRIATALKINPSDMDPGFSDDD